MTLAKRINTVLTVLAIICVANRAAPAQYAAKAAAIKADRQSIPQAEWGYYSYLDLDPWVDEERRELEAAIKLMVCSTSLKPVIEDHIPQKTPALVGTSLLRIDVRALGWAYEDWSTVLKRYPYWTAGKIPLYHLVRADWLLVQLADQQRSNAYPLLLYGSKDAPQNRDQILERLGVFNRREHVFGLIEGQSGVAKQGTRWLESRPVLRGYAWGTRDTDLLIKENDPLEFPDGNTHKHVAEEWIIGAPKLSRATGRRGALQVYFLANGEGQLQNRAPVDIVEDSTKFRGYAEIRNPGSCIQCHKVGLNLPTLNEFRQLVDRGAGALPFVADPEFGRVLEAFHMSDVSIEIERANDDYQTIVEIVTGMASTQAAEAFQKAVDRYDAPLAILNAAEEFVQYGYDVQDVQAALEDASTKQQIGVRLASLAREGKISREAWEEQYLIAAKVLKAWRENK